MGKKIKEKKPKRRNRRNMVKSDKRLLENQRILDIMREENKKL